MQNAVEKKPQRWFALLCKMVWNIAPQIARNCLGHSHLIHLLALG